jgi:sulfur carrier protein
MNVVINGKEASIPSGQTVPEYLASRGLDPKAVIIELNEAIIPRDQWTGLALADGDSLEIVSFVGGG